MKYKREKEILDWLESVRPVIVPPNLSNNLWTLTRYNGTLQDFTVQGKTLIEAVEKIKGKSSS